jgi:hypothetical protein
VHELTVRFLTEFRRLAMHEREYVARQMNGFLGAFLLDQDRTWREMVYVEGEGILGKSSSETLVELLNEHYAVGRGS